MKLIENEIGLAIKAESHEEGIELRDRWANSRKEWQLVCKLLLRRVEKLEAAKEDFLPQ